MNRIALGFAIAGTLGVAAGTYDRSSPAPAPATTTCCGVDRLHVRRTAEGHMLDLRYRVVDPERAGSLLGKDSRAYLVHERTGRQLQVPTTPKSGALRNRGVPRAGKIYFALFANPGGLVHRGDRVTVVLGDLKTYLTVE